jgi:hypothetical protein
MTTPDFTACGAKFKGNLSLYANYTYTGPAEGIWQNGQAPPLIALAGCEALYGTGNEYYGWAKSPLLFSESVQFSSIYFPNIMLSHYS